MFLTFSETVRLTNQLDSSTHADTPKQAESDDIVVKDGINPLDNGCDQEEFSEVHPFGIFQTFKLALLFCPIWFLMNFLFNISLGLTSVTSNTVLSTASGPFTLILCSIFLGDAFKWANVIGTFCVVFGATLVALQDSENNRSDGASSPVWGDTMALVSAFIYAIYGTLMKYKITDDTQVNMTLFFGFLGFLNACVLWPFFFLFSASQLESFAWPAREVWLVLTTNGLVNVLSDYLWARSILLTTPLIATLGLSLTIPVAFLSDLLFRQKEYNFLYIVGAVLVCMGFVVVNVLRSRQLEDEENEEINREELESQLSVFDVD
eukprot:876099_1